MAGLGEKLTAFGGGAVVAFAREFLIVAEIGGELFGFLERGEVVFLREDLFEDFAETVHWVTVPDYVAGFADELPVITLESELEQLLVNSVTANGATPGLEPGLADRLQQRLADAARKQETVGDTEKSSKGPCTMVGGVKNSVSLQVLFPGPSITTKSL